MANTIKIKNSGTAANVPSAASLQYGELALNYADGKLYFKTGASTVDFLKSNITLGTDTTGSYVSSLVAGTGITLTNNTGEGATPTIAVQTLNQNTTGSAATVTGAAQPAITSVGTLTSLNVSGTATASTTITNELRTSSGQQLIINAGESHFSATGQTNEFLYVNAESGLQVNSSPDNWASGWAGRKTATICATDGTSSFPGTITAPTFSGSGASLTSLPAGQLTGTVASARISGSYTGITSVGTLTGLTVTNAINGTLTKTVTGTNTADLIYGNMADNDQFRIRIGGTATNAGYVEIATADDGTEPIYVRQYTGVFSSLTRTATLLDGSGNTSFPGTITATTFNGSGASLTSLPAGQLTGTVASARISGSYTGITGLGALTTLLVGKVCSHPTVAGANDTGSFSVRGNASSPAVMSFHRTGAYAVNFGLSTNNVMELGGWSATTIKFSVNMINGNVTAVGGLNAYSISGNSNVAGTGNASYHPSGIYSTGTNWLYGTVLTNGNNIGAATQYVGAVYANNWFRSSGVSGWYNETYGGGIYMDNANEVKVYNGKAFYVPSSISSGSSISASGSINAGGMMGLSGAGIAYYGSSVGGGSANQIGFRWTNPYVNCTVDNVISAAAANFSDRRLKTNIKTLTNGIELVRQLRCITYNPLDVIGFEEETLEPIIGDLDPYDEMIGFVADEVQEVYANAIHGEGNRMKSIDTVQLLSMAVSAIQDLDTRLQQLETV